MKTALKLIKNVIYKISAIVGTIMVVILLLILADDIKMRRNSKTIVRDGLTRMGVYEDFPDFPDFSVVGYQNKRKEHRENYQIEIDAPIDSSFVSKLDSLSHIKHGLSGWHYDVERRQYLMFFWDIAREVNHFLIINPEKRAVSYVFLPPHRGELKTPQNDDLFFGPVSGSETK